VRVFIALRPDRELLNGILKKMELLKEKYPDFRWVSKENLHVTLAFLGETDSGFLPAIEETVKPLAHSGAILASGDRLFTLPRGRAANVAALGFGKGGDLIADLAEKLMKNLADHGILSNGSEKKFTPHITLARRGRTDLYIEKDDLLMDITGNMESVVIFESRLFSSGAVYSELAVFPLAAN